MPALAGGRARKMRRINLCANKEKMEAENTPLRTGGGIDHQRPLDRHAAWLGSGLDLSGQWGGEIPDKPVTARRALVNLVVTLG